MKVLTMIMDQPTLDYILNVIQTGGSLGITSFVIEPNRVRGIDEGRTVFVHQTTNVPVLPFGSVGLNRTNLFLSRYNMVKNVGKFEIDVSVDENKASDNGMFARSFTMKGTGIKIDYRCANPQVVQAPKNWFDVVKYRVRMTPEAISTMQKGVSAMAVEDVTFIGDETGVRLEIADINSDVLEYKFTDDVEDVDDATASISFTCRHSIKSILTLFKSNQDCHFHITAKGLIKVTLNNLDIYLIAKKV